MTLSLLLVNVNLSSRHIALDIIIYRYNFYGTSIMSISNNQKTSGEGGGGGIQFVFSLLPSLFVMGITL